jgi:hypothetical protein
MANCFDFVSDPGHGWLKVPVTELERLGIAHKISTYSYLRDGMAYLEEDCDFTVFHKARADRGEPFRIKEHVRNKSSRIRNYDHYSYKPAPVLAVNEDHFRKNNSEPVPMVTRVNLMSGLEYQEPADTPLCCSPASETYWSM